MPKKTIMHSANKAWDFFEKNEQQRINEEIEMGFKKIDEDISSSLYEMELEKEQLIDLDLSPEVKPEIPYWKKTSDHISSLLT